jgi:hypothetical protein
VSVAPRPWPGALEWGGDWLAEATEELAKLGFVLRDGGRAGTIPGPRLLVAFRAEPTLRHFDPEEATFWAIRDGRGRLDRITREVEVPLSRPFSWGRIVVRDRIPVTNQFLSFGGTLLAGAPDEGQTLVAFTSRAPIVRWAGHSQGVDPLADEIGAFFARLMVPVDFQADAEARIGAADPEALYAAFLQNIECRLPQGGPLRADDPQLATFSDHECHRLQRESPHAWAAGAALLASLEMG